MILLSLFTISMLVGMTIQGPVKEVSPLLPRNQLVAGQSWTFNWYSNIALKPILRPSHSIPSVDPSVIWKEIIRTVRLGLEEFKNKDTTCTTRAFHNLPADEGPSLANWSDATLVCDKGWTVSLVNRRQEPSKFSNPPSKDVSINCYQALAIAAGILHAEGGDIPGLKVDYLEAPRKEHEDFIYIGKGMPRIDTTWNVRLYFRKNETCPNKDDEKEWVNRTPS